MLTALSILCGADSKKAVKTIREIFVVGMAYMRYIKNTERAVAHKG
jgi:hypothetical protein